MNKWLAGLTFVVAFSARADELSLEEILPGVFLHQGVHEQMTAGNAGAIANSGFVIGEKAVAVIDPGGSIRAGLKLRQAIRSVTNLPVKHVVLTHFHPDHVIGAVVFSNGAEFVAHQNYPRAVTQRGDFYAERFSFLFEGTEPIEYSVPSQLVNSEYRIDLGNRELVVTAYPTGHTDNDITVTDLTTNSIWASDLVFEHRTPSLDGNLSGWLKILQDLAEQNFQTIIPGHGSPGNWQRTVMPQITYLNDLKRNVKDQIDRGLALSDVLKSAERGDNQQWVLYREQHPTNLTKAYTELEWD